MKWCVCCGQRELRRPLDPVRHHHHPRHHHHRQRISSGENTLQLPVAVAVDGLPPQRFSSSAIRLQASAAADGDCPSATLRPGDQSHEVVASRKDVLAHRGAVLSSVILSSARRSSCPVLFDDRSIHASVSQPHPCVVFQQNNCISHTL